ncbi:hypothetical protein HK102_005052 [Quaeritorhiza haematococci]|nr:hypothetical protein HK102_005052 [Quaeritorhiza haematococci]
MSHTPETRGCNPNGGGICYGQDEVLDLCVRTAAITILFGTIILYFIAFNFRFTPASRLIFAFLLTFLLGVIANFLDKTKLVPRRAWIKYWIGVGCYMFSHEAFVWTLYLRFRIITPFKRTLNQFVVGWLTLESLVSVAIYLAWGIGATRQEQSHGPGNEQSRLEAHRLRSTAERSFSILAIIQALTGAFLSIYFVHQYYIPVLKVAKGYGTGALFRKLLATGLLYLFLEVLLHCTYTITFYVTFTKKYNTCISNLATAMRYALFLLFVVHMRDVNRACSPMGAHALVGSAASPSPPSEPSTSPASDSSSKKHLQTRRVSWSSTAVRLSPTPRSPILPHSTSPFSFSYYNSDPTSVSFSSSTTPHAFNSRSRSVTPNTNTNTNTTRGQAPSPNLNNVNSKKQDSKPIPSRLQIPQNSYQSSLLSASPLSPVSNGLSNGLGGYGLGGRQLQQRPTSSNSMHNAVLVSISPVSCLDDGRDMSW